LIDSELNLDFKKFIAACSSFSVNKRTKLTEEKEEGKIEDELKNPQVVFCIIQIRVLSKKVKFHFK